MKFNRRKLFGWFTSIPFIGVATAKEEKPKPRQPMLICAHCQLEQLGEILQPAQILERFHAMLLEKLSAENVLSSIEPPAFASPIEWGVYDSLVGQDLQLSDQDLTLSLDRFSNRYLETAAHWVKNNMVRVAGDGKVAVAQLECPGGLDWSHLLTKDGLSVRLCRGFDIRTNTRITRFDVLCGRVAA